MDQSQKAIMAEIKDLESNYESGNNRKAKIATLVGGGVAAVGTALSIWYCPETLVEAIPYVSPLGQLLAGNAALSLAAGKIAYFFTNGKKEAKIALDKIHTNRVSQFLEKIKDAKTEVKTDFIFNLESTLYPAYQRKTELQARLDAEAQAKRRELNLTGNDEEILPLNMEGYIDEVCKTFLNLFNKPLNERPTIETINISNAELTDKQFVDMLAFGLGCCGTKKLILSQNRLDFKSIQNLRAYIVKKKHAFHSLKVLDLSDNNIPEDSLDDLVAIVRYLGIEELNLSGNPLNRDVKNPNYISPKLKIFLERQAKIMPTLKILKLAGVNLTDNFSKTLNIMISNPSILMHLDITNNPNLCSRKLRKLFEKGYQINQSLRELLVDQQEKLLVDDLIQKKEKFYEEMQALPDKFGNENDPKIVYLLNRFFQHKHLKKDTSEFLKEPLHSIMETVTKMIMDVRQRTLEIPEDYSIPISEKEFVRLMNDDLHSFYIEIIKEIDITVLDHRLFMNQEKVSFIKEISLTPYLENKRKAEELKKITASDRAIQCIKKAF